MKIMQTLSVSQ